MICSSVKVMSEAPMAQRSRSEWGSLGAASYDVTGMSMVTHSLKQPGVYSAGTPLDQQRKWLKNSVRFKQLDDMARKLARLEKRLAELEDGND